MAGCSANMAAMRHSGTLSFLEAYGLLRPSCCNENLESGKRVNQLVFKIKQ